MADTTPAGIIASRRDDTVAAIARQAPTSERVCAFAHRRPPQAAGDAMTSREAYDFAAAGRRGAERRWAARRAERLAAGLPATTREAQGRKPDRFDDPEVEAFWMERAAACGLFDEGDTSTQRRRKAHRFAAAEAAAFLNALATASGATASPSDYDVMVAYHEREIERLTEARRIALRNADTHLRVRGEHEKALAVLIKAGAE